MSAVPEKTDIPECPETIDAKSKTDPEGNPAKDHAADTSTVTKEDLSSPAEAPSPVAPPTDASNVPKESQEETSKQAAIDDSKSSVDEAPAKEEPASNVAEDFVPPPQDASGEKKTTTAQSSTEREEKAKAEDITAESTAEAAIKKPRKDPKRPKRQYIVKNPNRPKRPLSAYNLFFKEERERLVRKELESRDANLPIDELVNCQEKTRTGKRVHRKTHGAISFAVLGKMISANWKSLDQATKAKYEAEAAKDKERYQREVKAANDHLRANPPPDPMGPKVYNGKRPGESIDGSSEGSFYGHDPGKRLRTGESGVPPPTYPHGYFDGQYPPPYGPPPGYHSAGPPMHQRHPYYDYYGYDHAAFMPPHPNGGHSVENLDDSHGGPSGGPPGDPIRGPPPPGPPPPGIPPPGPPPFPPPGPYGYPYQPPPPDYYRGYGPPPPPNYPGFGPPPLTNDGSRDASNQAAQAFEPSPYPPHPSRPPQYDSYYHGNQPRYPPRPSGSGDSPRNADFRPWGPPPPHVPQSPSHQQPGHHNREFAFQCEVCNNAVFATFEECADHERECSMKLGPVQPSNGVGGHPVPPQPQNPHGMYPQQQISEEGKNNRTRGLSASSSAKSQNPGGKPKTSPSPRSKQKIREKAAVEAVLALKG